MSKRFDIHEWQAKQSLSEQTIDQASMNNADIRALQTVVSNYSLNKILNTIAVIADKTGKHNEADMIQNLAKDMNSESDYNDWINDPYLQEYKEELDELNMTGTGASFSAGSGEGYMSPNAFGDDKEKKMKAYKSIGYKKV